MSENCDHSIHPGDKVYQSNFGTIGPRVTAIMSIAGSSTIIYLIFRSESKFSSVYHRIMLGICISDILASTAIALTTLPMPRDDPDVNLMGFQGTRLGNTTTCTIQGFFYIAASYSTYLYYASICCYYACTIVFSIAERKLKKKIEPWLHIVPVALALSFAVPPLFFEMYNPTTSLSWCTLRTLPVSCKDDEDYARGSVKVSVPLRLYTVTLMFVDFAVIIVLLTLVCLKVRKQNIQFALYIKRRQEQQAQQQQQLRIQQQEQEEGPQQQHTEEEPPASTPPPNAMMMVLGSSKKSITSSSPSQPPALGMNLSNNININININIDQQQATITSKFKMTKVVTIHSLAYVLAFSLTLLIPSVTVFDETRGYTRVIHLIFLPLQGFFNFIIFTGSKIVSLGLADPTLTLSKAIKTLFFHNQYKEEVFLISNINYVEDDIGNFSLEVQERPQGSNGDNDDHEEGMISTESDSRNKSGNGSGNSGGEGISYRSSEWDDFHSNPTAEQLESVTNLSGIQSNDRPGRSTTSNFSTSQEAANNGGDGTNRPSAGADDTGLFRRGTKSNFLSRKG